MLKFENRCKLSVQVCESFKLGELLDGNAQGRKWIELECRRLHGTRDVKQPEQVSSRCEFGEARSMGGGLAHLQH